MPRAYQVVISGEVRNDARRIYEFIAKDKPGAARKWFRGFVKHARSLRSLPFRYEEIPEAARFGVPFRHVIFGNYRIIYVIEERRIRVVRVLHAAREMPDDFLSS